MKRILLDQTPCLKKSLTSLIILLIISTTGFSQNVGISPAGTTPPDPAAGLDVNFTDKGLLISRVALTSSTSPAPLTAHVVGMMVYNTATAGDVIPGLYFNDGTKWVSTLPPAGTATGNMQYWNGTAWVIISTGLPGQKLVINSSGVPAWSN
jgi:hypothetical protein